MKDEIVWEEEVDRWSLGKEGFFSSAVVPRRKKEKASTTRSSREKITKKKIRRRKKGQQNAGGIVEPQPPPTRSRKENPSQPTAMLPENDPSLAREKRQESIFRFSFLDVEERARLSMPSFLLQVQKKSANNKNPIKHCQTSRKQR